MEKYIKIKVKKKKETLLKECGEVISLTCGDQGENHVGMDKVGNMVKEGEGFNLNDFKDYMLKFEKEGYVCELYNLNDLYNDSNVFEATKCDDKSKLLELGVDSEAYVLVVRKGMDKFLKDNGKKSYDL